MKTTLFTTLGAKLSTFGAKTMLKTKQYSPEICLGVGAVTVVVGIVFACKETLKVESILDEHHERRQEMEDVHTDETQKDKYTDEMYQRDKAVLTVQTGVKLARNYIPSVFMVSSGFVLIFASYRIQKTRNVALMAAYASLSEAFSKYRDRVREELGEDKDQNFLYGTRDEKVKITGEDGKKQTVTEKTIEKSECEALGYSMYARVFDETSSEYRDDNQDNRVFLHCQQNWANDRLRSHGHVFLNEVYDALGFEHTKAGSVVGWVYGEGHQNFIDFGMFNVRQVGNRDFLNGQDRYIILDFNVDGVIYDLIEKDRKRHLPRVGNAV